MFNLATYQLNQLLYQWNAIEISVVIYSEDYIKKEKQTHIWWKLMDKQINIWTKKNVFFCQ